MKFSQSRREARSCLAALGLQLVLIVTQISSSSQTFLTNEGDADESQDGDASSAGRHQQGSWAHWWSYDGISGPDYWNINKRWRLCSLGRKQSPIDLRTERLVFDHLLGPLQFGWLPAGANSLSEARRFDGATGSAQKPIKVQLLNSGRGVEVWLEPAPSVPLTSSSASSSASSASATSSSSSSSSPTSSLTATNQDQLILAKGPLSYAYKCFKLELHSSSALGLGPASNTPAQPRAAPSDPAAASGDSAEGLADEAETPAELGVARSSEHLIDGRAFDAELQLHFYNKHLAASAAEALRLTADEDTRPSLFAVVSVFIKVVAATKDAALETRVGHSNNDTDNGRAPPPAKSSLDFLFDNLAAIPNEGNSIETQLTRAHLEALVSSRHEYVTYQGSLNRPPCSESVDWILLNKALRVDQFKFQGLFEKLNTNQDNVRPVKPLNRRLLRTTIATPAAGLMVNERPVDCAKTNCSQGAPARANQKSLGRQSCSMKPNYAYRLTGHLLGSQD